MQADPSAPGAGDPAAPAAVVTPFPPPPPFFRLYARGARAGPPPPPPPSSADAPVVVFGAEHRASEDPVAPLQVPDLLRQAGVSQPGAADPRRDLHLLLDAVLASALRLLDTLVDSPGDYAAGATAAIGALHNLMHAINALRPGQTRHALARALEAQVGHKREAARAVREAARAAGEELARRAAEVEGAAVAAAAAAVAGADQGNGAVGDAMEVEALEGGAAKAGPAKAAGRSGGIAAAAPATG